MELWDAYDSNRRKKGYTIERSSCIEKGDFHLVVHVCVFNTRDEMLIQKRKVNKENWPGIWDFSSGGAALAGENSQAAAGRELKEELNLEVDFSDHRPVVTVHFEEGFDDYYIVHIDKNVEKKILYSADEIDEVRWVSCDELLQLISFGESDLLKSFVMLIYDMHKKRGNHS